MNLHEYQAKHLLMRYNIKVPRGEIVSTPEGAADIFRQLEVRKAVVKAQIHSGGRGKAGAIKIVHSSEEAERVAHELIGKTFVTYQTGPQGKTVKKLLIEEVLPIMKELYVGITIDRRKACPVIMASTEGGMDIEDLARTAPEKIIKFEVTDCRGLQPFQARELVYMLGLNEYKDKCQMDIHKYGINFFIALTKLFINNDCSLVEVNPLIISENYGLVALDAKVNLDDRGLFRHPDFMEWRDIHQEHPLEYEASKHDLSYIGLDGNIGCMVNGAGLAMATMDLIKLHGGEPANFLDVGGGATKEQVANAFKLLVSNPNVKAILVNIFGGIMKCDIIAEGIIAAVKEVGLSLPLVVRLEGTNVELGKKILQKSGLNIISASSMSDAAEKVVKTVNFIK